VRFLLTASLIWLTISSAASAQWMGKQTGCYADQMAANPNRPTVANPADITQYGVLEVEWGYDHLWPARDLTQTSTGGLLKFGLLCDVELRWNTTPYLSQADPTGTHRTYGDNWLGPQVRFYRQTAHVPSMAVSYALKIPSADTTYGLGSGRVDHALTFLASKDIGKFHADFNATELWIGRAGASGFDRNQQMNLAVSHGLVGGLQIQGEWYGDTRLNATSPEFVSSLWALTYAVTPRFVIDSGYELGLTAGGPHRHVFAGLTYSIGNLYPGWRHRPIPPATRP
jgi:hypothetical protein